MTAKQVAARAAEEDFNRLRRFCEGDWAYCGVVVELLGDDDEPTGDSESVWGIESDAGDYLDETAHECAGEILARISAAGHGVHAHA